MKKESNKPKTIWILYIFLAVLLTSIIYAATAPNPGHIGSEINVDCPNGGNNIPLETCLQNLVPPPQTITCPIGGTTTVENCINNLNTQLQTKISSIDVKIFCIGYSCSAYGYTSGGSVDHEGGHSCWDPSTSQFVAGGDQDDEICYKIIP